MARNRELSIFVDESGDFGPPQKHAPFYILSLVFHDQSDDIRPRLATIHHALTARGLTAAHAIHTGPLVRREGDYTWMGLPERRSLFRVLFDFARVCEISYRSWAFEKFDLQTSDRMIGAMSRELGAFLREHSYYFECWDRVVIYYDNGQREITNLVNSVFNAHLNNVEVKRVVPAEYSLFQVADLCCTLSLLEKKVDLSCLSRSERVFFSTRSSGAERALRKNYLKPMQRKFFGS